MVARYAALVSVVYPPAVPRVVANDPDGSRDRRGGHRARCAHRHRKHLLPIGSHQGVAIVTEVQALARGSASRTARHPKAPELLHNASRRVRSQAVAPCADLTNLLNLHRHLSDRQRVAQRYKFGGALRSLDCRDARDADDVALLRAHPRNGLRR